MTSGMVCTWGMGVKYKENPGTEQKGTLLSVVPWDRTQHSRRPERGSKGWVGPEGRGGEGGGGGKISRGTVEHDQDKN